MKIYTKTGDGGETGLWGGGRIPKDAIRINAYGTVDECNAVLGLVRVHNPGDRLDGMLDRIQHLLFVVGSDLATPADVPTAIPRITDADISLLEEWIDLLESSLPALKQFIIPGGHPAAAYLHMARTVFRRAERWPVSLSRQEPACATVVKFLNRLSVFLLVAARTANHQRGLLDIPWKNPHLRQKP